MPEYAYELLTNFNGNIMETITKKRIYIAGCYSDGDTLLISEQKENARMFRKAQVKLTLEGWAVINPIEMDWRMAREEGITYQDVMDSDIAIIDGCHAIFMLKGWENSRGAVREHTFAKEKGLEIIYQDCEHKKIIKKCDDCGVRL